MGFVVTIDGPAASGKSSVSRGLAKLLSVPWVSTGAFYRGLAYAAIHTGTDLNDRSALTELAMSNDWRVIMTQERTQVWFHSSDVTNDISQEQVGNVASQISSYPEVRSSLLDNQRQCAFVGRGLVAEGRDCGTVVFPQAEVKVYLTASSEHRAQRRAQELGLNHEELVTQQKQRDHQDSNRKVAPLQVPAEALVIDTTEMTLDEVVKKIYNFAIEKIRSS
jgi:cytidylate kinase